jgi:hypothetical protein
MSPWEPLVVRCTTCKSYPSVVARDQTAPCSTLPSITPANSFPKSTNLKSRVWGVSSHASSPRTCRKHLGSIMSLYIIFSQIPSDATIVYMFISEQHLWIYPWWCNRPSSTTVGTHTWNSSSVLWWSFVAYIHALHLWFPSHRKSIARFKYHRCWCLSSSSSNSSLILFQTMSHSP